MGKGKEKGVRKASGDRDGDWGWRVWIEIGMGSVRGNRDGVGGWE